MTSVAELKHFLRREAERLPTEDEARATQLTASGATTRHASLRFGVSVGMAAFAIAVTFFVAPLLWHGLRNTSQAGPETNAPDVSTAAEGQITADALLRVCPDCNNSSNHVFVVTDLYESGSPLSEFIRPMAGKSKQSISAVIPDAAFVEADTEEAAAAYEEAGNRRAVVVTFSPVAHETEAVATVSVGVIWGSYVTETSVKFHWNGSEWAYDEVLPACQRTSSDDAC